MVARSPRSSFPRGPMMRNTKYLRRGALALAVAVAPFALGHNVANAAVNQDQKTVSLTFVTLSSQTVTCSLTGTTSHDTAGSVNTNSTTNLDPRCNGALDLEVIYNGDDGRQHRTFAATDDSCDVGLSVDHVAADGHNVLVAHTETFNQCDSRASATCLLRFEPNPK